jgi:hypothetical protein
VVRLHDDAPVIGPVPLEGHDHLLVVHGLGSVAFAATGISLPRWRRKFTSARSGPSRRNRGTEYTTFREAIARQALAAEGGRARIEFHEQERNGFMNVYLDKVGPLEDDEPSSNEGGG